MVGYVRNDVGARRIVTATLDEENELILTPRNLTKLGYAIIQVNCPIRSNVSCEPENVLLDSQIPKTEERLKAYVFQKITSPNASGTAPANWGWTDFFDLQNNPNNRKERAALEDRFNNAKAYDDPCNDILLGRLPQIPLIRAETMISHINNFQQRVYAIRGQFQASQKIIKDLDSEFGQAAISRAIMIYWNDMTRIEDCYRLTSIDHKVNCLNQNGGYTSYVVPHLASQLGFPKENNGHISTMTLVNFAAKIGPSTR
jgi:hypothetical protein